MNKCFKRIAAIFSVIAIIVAISIVIYRKYTKYKDIK